MEVSSCRCSGGITRCDPKRQQYSKIFFLELYDVGIAAGFIVFVLGLMSYVTLDGIKSTLSTADQIELNSSQNTA